MINFIGPKLSYKFLRKLVLPSPQVLRKQLALAFLASLILNISFLIGLKSYHDNYWLLGVLCVLNFTLANYLLFIQMKGVLAFSTSKRRLGFSQIIAFFAYLFPLYQVYLYYLCLYHDREKKLNNSSLFWRPISLAILLSAVSLFGGAPSKNKLLSVQLSPELNYISQVGVEAYQIFQIKKDYQEDCVASDNWQCINEHLKDKIFPSTNTGIILGTAVDALVTFKKKKELQEKTKNEDEKSEVMFIATENLLVSNVQFLKENSCSRRKAIHFISPIPLITGPFTAYMLQFVDVHISKNFEQVASEKLSGLSKKLVNSELPKERTRKVASLIPLLENPKSNCEKL